MFSGEKSEYRELFAQEGEAQRRTGDCFTPELVGSIGGGAVPEVRNQCPLAAAKPMARAVLDRKSVV